MNGPHTDTYHEPVLLSETITALDLKPGGTYIDCTLGGGGHSEAILEQIGEEGRLLGLDADPDALSAAAERLGRFGERATLVQSNFSELAEVARQRGFEQANGILFDLGVSAHQLTTAERGFSVLLDAPLDMRFSPKQETTAAHLVNDLSEQELADVIYRYGEEPRSRRIAREIVAQRPVRTTGELAAIVSRALGGRKSHVHPATQVFQALRIAVNRELESLEAGLKQALELLVAHGRLVVISFHSLEDRLVKEFFRAESTNCVCPPKMPVCICEHKARLKLLTRKVVKPSEAEVARNPRSRSAKLRAAELI